jgi:hypothetical protein
MAYPKKGTLVELTLDDRLLAAKKGVLRDHHDRLLSCTDHRRSENDSLLVSIQGALGEVAAKKLLGEPLELAHERPELADGFIPDTNIPYDVKVTTWTSGALMVPIKNGAKYLHGLFLLFTGPLSGPLTFRGCHPAEFVITEARQDNPGRGWCYKVPHWQLMTLDGGVKYYEGAFREKHPRVYAVSAGFDGSTPRPPVIRPGGPADAGRLPGDGQQGRPAEVDAAGRAARDG